MHTPTRTSAVLMSLLASATLLSACGERSGENTTAGQRIDQGVAQGERQVAQATEAVRETGRDAGQAMGNAGDAVGNKSRDMAITAAVNARLTADQRLSALAIDVDTADGRVVLRGSAPDTAARTRATELAREVDGVREVNNELSVQPPRSN